MNSYVIDTHSAIKKLEAVGFPPEQAEVVTSLFSSREAELATKSDLRLLKGELKTDIAELRTELKNDIAELRTELKGDIAELKGDISRLYAGHAVLQEQIKSIRIQNGVVLAVTLAMLAMLVPVFLQLFDSP